MPETQSPPKRHPQIITTKATADGALKIELSKPAANALARAREYCGVIGKACPTLKAQAVGIEAAIQRLLATLAAGGPAPEFDGDGDQP